MENIKISIVSENKEWVENLSRAISALKPKWLINKYSTIQNAQESAVSIHAIVVDSDLPKNEITNLFLFLQTNSPATAKFLWIDVNNRNLIKELVTDFNGIPPQCIWKQQSESIISEAIFRTVFFENWLTTKQIRKVLVQMRDIPTIPFVYLKLMSLIDDPCSSAEDIAATVAEDPSLCAKMLKLANSAIIGLREPVSSPFEAVMQLGVERIKALTISSNFVSQFDNQKVPWFSIDRFWNHSIMTASFSRWIAMAKTKDVKLADSSFTAGLLHDVGILLIAANIPQAFNDCLSSSIANNIPLWQAEKSLLGFNHAEIAACLLSSWGLPLAILEAIAAHHNPGIAFSTTFSPLTAVHIANQFSNENQNYPNLCGDLKIDKDYLTKMNCLAYLDEWKKMCVSPQLNTKDQKPDSPQEPIQNLKMKSQNDVTI